MKQDEKADDQEPSVITENSSGSGLTVSDPTNSRTSNFSEQAVNLWESMDCDNPDQCPPFTEHQVQEIENQLKDAMINGSCNELMMSPAAHGSSPTGQLSDLDFLISDYEADMGVIQDGQHGETSLDKYWAKQNQRPVCDTLKGVVPLEEEEEVVEQKLNHPRDTEKIIREYTSSDGAPAKVKAWPTEFKEKETTLLQPKKKKDHVKVESDNISHWETRMDSPSPRRSTASTSSCRRNKPTIDIRVYLYLAMLLAFAYMVCTIVDGICRISEDINETIQDYVFFRRF